jgi:hypothetical protein
VASLKPGSKVFIKAGSEPFLIGYHCGKGRVAVLTGTTLGEFPARQSGYWEQEQWPVVLRNLMAWLTRRDEE